MLEWDKKRFKRGWISYSLLFISFVVIVTSKLYFYFSASPLQSVIDHSFPPPPGPVRIIAEWEPAIGTLVAWPFKIPNELVKELVKEEELYVLLQQDEEEEALEDLIHLGVSSERVHLIPCSVRLGGVRDFGPHQMFDGDGRWSILDPIFWGWPFFDSDQPPFRKGDKIDYSFGWSPDEDRVCDELAKYFKALVYPIPAFLAGGNFIVDGLGTAFCTEAQIRENETIQNEKEFRSQLLDYMGINRLHVLKNIEKKGIQHIDCWLKLLDEERILIKRPPAGHPEEKRIDQNLAILRSLKTPYKRLYQIYEIHCPPIPKREWMGQDRETPGLAPYTNALILNQKSVNFFRILSSHC